MQTLDFKMNRTLVFTTILIFSLFISSKVLSDIWVISDAESEVCSQAKTYCLRIIPNHKKDGFGNCQAILYKLTEEKKEEVWSRYLINDTRPFNVFVADSGRYVVTMDETGRIGKLPIVIYDDRGRLVRVHSRETLDLNRDYNRIQRTMYSFWWSEDSVSFFGPNEQTFIITHISGFIFKLTRLITC